MKVGGTGGVNKNEVIQQFRQLPLEIRLEEAVRTMNEFKAVEKKWKSVMDGLALGSEKYKEAVSRKKPIDRFVDKIMDAFESYLTKMMAGGISTTDKEKLRDVIASALEEGEDEGGK